MSSQGDAGPLWTGPPGVGPPARKVSMEIEQVLTVPPHEGYAGAGLLICTTRGDIVGILHRPADDAIAGSKDAGSTDAGDANAGGGGSVVWVCGARGGFGGPAGGLYAELAQEFAGQGIASLRLDYRQPNDIMECALDVLAGITFLRGIGRGLAVLVGHSFGGAVVIAAGSLGYHTAGVVSLSPQTYGAQGAGLLFPVPLLVAHGEADTRLPCSGAVAIYDWAKEPRQLVLYEGAEHRLDECRSELAELLREWIPARLAGAASPGIREPG